ncbi:MAG: pyridoxamine 5'-phosphate oxidase, partial [Chitinophagaceae bacterium]
KVSSIRTDYTMMELLEKNIILNPMDMFDQWWKEALEKNPMEVNAFTLSTIDKQKKPHSRIMLLKGYDKIGFIFYTNYESNKGKEISENSNVSMLFFWMNLQRQVRIEGIAKKVSRIENEAYFAERPRKSQIGAWASKQSKAIPNREYLEKEEKKYIQQFDEIEKIPCPEYWGGFLVKPINIEFWQGRQGRLHDRIVYVFKKGIWSTKRLSS